MPFTNTKSGLLWSADKPKRKVLRALNRRPKLSSTKFLLLYVTGAALAVASVILFEQLQLPPVLALVPVLALAVISLTAVFRRIQQDTLLALLQDDPKYRFDQSLEGSYAFKVLLQILPPRGGNNPQTLESLMGIDEYLAETRATEDGIHRGSNPLEWLKFKETCINQVIKLGNAASFPGEYMRPRAELLRKEARIECELAIARLRQRADTDLQQAADYQQTFDRDYRHAPLTSDLSEKK